MKNNTTSLFPINTIGSRNGSLSQAMINQPSGVCVDLEGNIVFTDRHNHSIKKIVFGEVITIAGCGEEGFDDGDALEARFNLPSGLCVDRDGSVIVCDCENNAVRRVTVNGMVETIAGGERGFKDGVGREAQFYFPRDVCIDHEGNVLVTDMYNNSIRKIISRTGMVVTVVDSDNSFDSPSGICVDGLGNILFIDRLNHSVKMVDVDGEITTIVGNGMPGNADGIFAQLKAPIFLCLDVDENIIISDFSNNLMRKYDRENECLTTFELFHNNEKYLLKQPSGVCFDHEGNIIIAAFGNNDILKVGYTTEEEFFDDTAPYFLFRITQNTSTFGNVDGILSIATLNQPSGVCIDLDGNIVFTDRHNNQIRKIIDNQIITIAGNGKEGFNDGYAMESTFKLPSGICVDMDGSLIVCDCENNAVRRITTDGNVETIAGCGQRGFKDGVGSEVQFYFPRDVCIDLEGNILVSDMYNKSIRKIISKTGEVVTISSPETGGTFDSPSGMCIDKKGNLYIVDRGNNSIKMINVDGELMNISGTGEKGSKDGRDATFDSPIFICIDNENNLLVTDFGSSCIRMIPTSNLDMVSTIELHNIDQALNNPSGICIDHDGNIIVAAFGNNAIMKIKCISQMVQINRVKSVLDELLHDILAYQTINIPFPSVYEKVYDLMRPPYSSGKFVYKAIISSINDYIETVFLKKILSGKSDEEILIKTALEWEKLQTSIAIIADISLGIDILYVTSKRGTKPVKDKIFDEFRKSISNASFIQSVLSQSLLYIRKDRENSPTERSIIMAISKMYYDHRTLAYYVKSFENVVLDDTLSFYENERDMYWVNCDGIGYIDYVFNRVKEELERSEAMLLESSLPKIKKTAIYALLSSKSVAMIKCERGIWYMLENDIFQSLEQTYYLYSSLDNGLSILASTLSEMIREEGQEINEIITNPIKYVSAVFSLGKKYDLIYEAMGKDSKLRATISKSFSYFLDSNNFAVQYLVDYSSAFFTREFRKMDDVDITNTMESITNMFKLVGEKLLFESLYKRELSKRLLQRWTVGIEKELEMVKLLKSERGSQFSHKLEGMLMDMKTSSETEREFFLEMDRRPPIAINFTVLTRTLWPSQNRSFCELPSEITIWMDNFIEYWYIKKTEILKVPKEKLQIVWQPNLGFCVIEAQLGGDIYTIKLSTYQMCILIKFNDQKTYRFPDLQSATGLSSSELEKELFLLSRYKIVEKNLNDELQINDNFSYKGKAFEILAISTTEIEKKKKMLQIVDSTRRDLIEAAIVRTMKQNNTMDHIGLVEAVVSNLSSRFNANKNIVEARIRVLAEQKYMTITENTYTYNP